LLTLDQAGQRLLGSASGRNAAAPIPGWASPGEQSILARAVKELRSREGIRLTTSDTIAGWFFVTSAKDV